MKILPKGIQITCFYVWLCGKGIMQRNTESKQTQGLITEA
jgi:hypothetical protein